VRISNDTIGAIGEHCAKKHLVASGFALVQFGKALAQKLPRGIRTLNLPSLPDYGIGRSFGNFPSNPVEFGNPWVDSDVPAWADLPKVEILRYAHRCRCERAVCAIRDERPAMAPCAQLQRLLDKDWLTSITPFNPLYDEWKVHGKDVIPRGFELVNICLSRVNRLSLREYRNDVTKAASSFILSNMLVTDYIERKKWQLDEERGDIGARLPHDGMKIADVWQKQGEAAADALRVENREAMKKDPYWKQDMTHPGRYDFVGYKASRHYAIEVKVNTSQPSYWQCIRLGLLERLGHPTMNVRVTLTKEQLASFMAGNEVDPENINIESPVKVGDAPVPTIEEMQAVLNYQAKHERHQAQVPLELRDRLGYD
jgi:hypothetical protein